MTNPYTVVGLLPDNQWGDGMREASFVTRIDAMSPAHAGNLVRREIAAEHDCAAGDVQILAAFEGRHHDHYDPSVDADDAAMAKLDQELNA